MDTIFIISIIFVVIYNTWYDSYITHLFLLASKDTEKNSQRLKMIWSLKGNWLMKTVKSIYFYRQPSKTQININHQTI